MPWRLCFKSIHVHPWLKKSASVLPVPQNFLALFGVNQPRHPAVTQTTGISRETMHVGENQFSVLPSDVHLEAAAGAQAFYAAGRPDLQQGGEDLYFIVLAL